MKKINLCYNLPIDDYDRRFMRPPYRKLVVNFLGQISYDIELAIKSILWKE